ncbi:phage portal protein, lambda family [Gloeobacter kilaueensis JS1]|uniref:Phage portal protein, lambda family n=2 Tax=Gloeobacter TaxID=33071 RepID=U5QE38_GLOK1|nr:phage portal protein, lambda family [Gloeobacter kilaueensis JS1]
MGLIAFLPSATDSAREREMARRARASAKERESAVATESQYRQFAAALLDRTTSDWIPYGTSADAELFTSLVRMRSRARQQVRDNPYARGAVRTIVQNVVGLNVGFQSRVMMLRGGKLDDGTNARIEKAWNRWCKKKYCSANGKHSFASMLRLAVGRVAVDGEVIVRFRRKAFSGSTIPLALQVIESDQLAEDYNRTAPGTGNPIRMGVEVDADERPVAYWIRPNHPGDYQFVTGGGSIQPVRIPAEEILHLAVFDRAGQTRAESWFCAALLRLKQMSSYEDAEIIRARAAACRMGFLKTTGGSSAFADLETTTGKPTVDPADGVTRQVRFAPGQFWQLQPNEEVDIPASPPPGDGGDPFLRMMLRSIATSIGISYATFANDHGQSNFSSSRLSLLDDRDNWRVIQAWLIENLIQPIFERWLDTAVLYSALDLPNYFADPERYSDCRWKPRGWAWIDPLKDVQSAILAVNAGLDTLTNQITQNGGDVEDLFKERRIELDLAEQYRIPLAADTRVTNNTAAVDPSATADSNNTAAGDNTNAQQ